MTFYLDNRPKNRTKEEQAKINADMHQKMAERIKYIANCALEDLKRRQDLSHKISTGEIAIVEENEVKLKFNQPLTRVSYGQQSLELKKNVLSYDLLRALVNYYEKGIKNAIKTKKWHENVGIKKDMLRGYIGAKDEESVDNAYKRMNEILYNHFGIRPIKRKDNYYYLDSKIEHK